MEKNDEKYNVFVMGIFALIYPYSLNRRLFSFVDKLYSLWILHFIPRADRSVLFERFCDLRGGECMVIGEKLGLERIVLLIVGRNIMMKNFIHNYLLENIVI